MKCFRFIQESRLPESLLHNKAILELVKKMRPDDVFQTLVKDIGLHPSDAAVAAGALLKHANATMSMPYPNKDLGKLAKKKKDETFGMGAPDSPISVFMFPDEEEEDSEWPYDAATKGIMNTPLAAGPRMTT